MTHATDIIRLDAQRAMPAHPVLTMIRRGRATIEPRMTRGAIHSPSMRFLAYSGLYRVRHLGDPDYFFLQQHPVAVRTPVR
ncbi:MAG: hypothetical protein WCO42_02575 [bacterium]